MAKRLVALGIVLIAVGALAYWARSRGWLFLHGKKPSTVEISADCRPDRDPAFTDYDGQKVKFKRANGNHYKIVITQKPVTANDAYFPDNDDCVPDPRGKKQTDLTLNAEDPEKDMKCGLEPGSGTTKTKWQYRITLYDQGNPSPTPTPVCQSPDPNICIVKCVGY